MSLSTQCPDCGKEYRLGEDKAGKRFKCKACGGAVTVPAAAAEAETGTDEGEDFFDDEWDPSAAQLPGGALRGAGPSGKAKKKPQASGGTGKKKGGSKAKAGGSKSKKAKSKKEKPAEKNNTVLIASIAAGVLLLAGLSFLLFSGGDEEEGTDAGNTVAQNTATNPAENGNAANGGEQSEENTTEAGSETTDETGTENSTIGDGNTTETTDPETPTENTTEPDAATAPEKVVGIPGGLKTEYLPNGTVLSLVLNPARLMNSPFVKAIPPQVIEEGLQQSPIDPRKIEQVTLAIVPPAEMWNVLKFEIEQPTNTQNLQMAPEFPNEFDMYVGIINFTEPAEPKTLTDLFNLAPPGSAPQFEEKTHRGKSYTSLTFPGGLLPIPEIEQPALALYFPEAQTAVLATENMVKQIIDSGEVGGGPMAEKLANISAERDLLLSFSFADQPVLRQFTRAVMNKQGLTGLPVNIDSLPDQLKNVSLSVDFSGANIVGFSVEGVDGLAAEELKSLLDQLAVLIKGGVAAWNSQPGRDPDQQELSQEVARVVNGISVTQTENEITLALANPAGEGSGRTSLSMMLNAVQSARAAARRVQVKNNLKQIAVAMHNYIDTHKTLPPSGIDEDGNLNLSWRVQLLPSLEYQNLYDQMDAAGTWESEENQFLLDRMPTVFTLPGEPPGSRTQYQAFTGEGTIFPDGMKIHLSDIRDGLSNTIFAIIAGPETAEVWTKPGGIPFDPENPRGKLGTIPETGLLTLMGDGRVVTLRPDIDNETLAALITISGGETVNVDDWTLKD